MSKLIITVQVEEKKELELWMSNKFFDIHILCKGCKYISTDVGFQGNN